MSAYVIGDVQGCFDALMALLKKLAFDPRRDRLYFTGDLINRGGQSVDVLRWVMAHQGVCQSVLGNHDLSVLHRYHQPGSRPVSAEIDAIFSAPDAELLLAWLQSQPLLHEIRAAGADADNDSDSGHKPWWLSHAGVYPLWSAKEACQEAHFAENLIQHHTQAFFAHLFGNRPCRPVPLQPSATDRLPSQRESGSPSLDEHSIMRMRFAINAFTRMRFLDDDACLNFEAKGPPEKFPHLHAWFRFPQRVPLPATVLYGHWSALGLHQENNTVCLDTGKVWGGQLTAMRLPEAPGQKPEFIAV